MRKGKMVNIISNTEIEDLHPFVLFRTLNSTKHENHSANKICRSNDGKLIAVRCNCDKRIYHPIMDNKVYWEENILAQNISFLKKFGLKGLWISED